MQQRDSRVILESVTNQQPSLLLTTESKGSDCIAQAPFPQQMNISINTGNETHQERRVINNRMVLLAFFLMNNTSGLFFTTFYFYWVIVECVTNIFGLIFFVTPTSSSLPGLKLI